MMYELNAVDAEECAIFFDAHCRLPAAWVRKMRAQSTAILNPLHATTCWYINHYWSINKFSAERINKHFDHERRCIAVKKTSAPTGAWKCNFSPPWEIKTDRTKRPASQQRTGMRSHREVTLSITTTTEERQMIYTIVLKNPCLHPTGIIHLS